MSNDEVKSPTDRIVEARARDAGAGPAETEAQAMTRLAERIFGPRPPAEQIDRVEAARRRLDAARRHVVEHCEAARCGFVAPPESRERARAELRAAEMEAMTMGIDPSPAAAMIDFAALRALVNDPSAALPHTSAIPIDRMVLHALLNLVQRVGAETVPNEMRSPRA